MSFRLVEALNKSEVHYYASEDFLSSRLTPLVGREFELETLQNLLQERQEVRFLTLSGPGGIGKTRLALATAERLAQAGEFSGGIYFISLASLKDTEMVLPVISEALSVSRSVATPLPQLLKEHVSKKGKVLLILDNCEMVVEAAPHLLDLLVASPDLKIMLTSRRLMRLRGEYEFCVPPLALPSLSDTHLNPLRYSAVQFFVERVKLVRPDFNLTPEIVPPIIQICQYLEGLPLALELAAPRLKMLSPEGLLARLTQRLILLSTNSQDVPTRQRTMHSSIEWSYSLLSGSVQTLMQRLSVFSGSWSLEAAEAICASQPHSGNATLNVLESLEELVSHSLVVVSPVSQDSGGQVRYRLLEPIRQYAQEQLLATASPEEQAQLQRTHSDYYLSLAETTDIELYGSNQATVLQRQAQDYPNTRAALGWLLTINETEQALRMAGTLARYWMMRHQSEGQLWLESALNQRTGQESPEVCAKALFGLGNLAYIQTDFVRAMGYFEEVLKIHKQNGNKAGIAQALRGLAATYSYQNRLPQSLAMQQESLALYRELDDKPAIAGLLSGMGINYLRQAELEAARLCLEEALELLKPSGNPRAVALTLGNLATVELEQKNTGSAKKHFLRSLAVFRELGDNLMVAFILNHLGKLALIQNDLRFAREWLEEALRLGHLQNHQHGIASAKVSLARLMVYQAENEQALELLQDSINYFQLTKAEEQLVECLEVLAELSTHQKELERVVILSAAAAAGRSKLKLPLLPNAATRQSKVVEQVKNVLAAPRYKSLWEYGATLSIEEAIEAKVPPFEESIVEVERVEVESKENTAVRVKTNLPILIEELTRREIEVLKLVGQGLRNIEIADQLFLSKHTVSTHIHSIFEKLGVNNRTAAVHLASELQLI